MKQFIKNLPMRSKLVLIIVTVCSAVLMLTCLVLFWFQSVAFRQSFVVELQSLAFVVAHNSAAPLTFKDSKSAKEILSALKIKAHITGACIFDDHDQVFAYYYDGEPDASPVPGVAEGTVGFRNGNAVLRLPIMDSGTRLGTLHLRAEFDREYHWLLRQDAGLMLVVLTGALVVILILSSLLQGAITGPILELISVARNVSDKEDYVTRAPEAGRDEVGLLTRSFNQMLDQIQSRDERLRESQQRYEIAVLGSSDGLWDWDLITNAVYFSPRWKTMLGYTDPELPNTFDTYRSLLHPEDTARVFDKIDAYLNARDFAYEVEFRLRHKDGNCRWILSRGVALRDEHGKPFRFAGSHTDITERKQVDANLRETLTLQRAIFDAASYAIVSTTVDGTVHTFNRAAEQMFGYPVGEVVGRATPALWHDRDEVARRAAVLTRELKFEVAPGFEAFVAKARLGQSDENEWTIVRKDGTRQPVQLSVTALREASGEITGFLGVLADISVRKTAEAEMTRLNRQLVDTSRAAGMAEVATGVLHNVGNVLNSVNVSANLVADKLRASKIVNLGKAAAMLREHQPDLGAFLTDDPKGRQLPGYLVSLADHLERERAVALQEVDSLRKDVDHIKDIVAMQQSYARVSGVVETLSLSALAEDALRMNEAALLRHEVRLVREFAEIPLVPTDKHKVLQILVNLIRNAKYALDERGHADKRVTVRIAAAGPERVMISVGDNGVGIPAENLTRIFGHGFTTKQDGHGFGLHSGALAAKEMGGSLSVHSDGLGHGATFTLELPVAAPTTL